MLDFIVMQMTKVNREKAINSEGLDLSLVVVYMDCNMWEAWHW